MGSLLELFTIEQQAAANLAFEDLFVDGQSGESYNITEAPSFLNNTVHYGELHPFASNSSWLVA